MGVSIAAGEQELVATAGALVGDLLVICEDLSILTTRNASAFGRDGGWRFPFAGFRKLGHLPIPVVARGKASRELQAQHDVKWRVIIAMHLTVELPAASTLIVNFVFELPAGGHCRYRLGHADQDAAVPFEVPGPEIEILPKSCGPPRLSSALHLAKWPNAPGWP